MIVETVTWLEWDFGVYEHDADWPATPGLYVFALRESERWIALYVGQTESFCSRLPTHPRWLEAVRLGATHVHAREESRAHIRSEMESRLVQALQPRMNVLLR